jgi:kinesin family member 1
MDTYNSELSSVKVCVRVRPFNNRERKQGSTCIIRMHKNATIVTTPETINLMRDQQNSQIFSYDHSFWSCSDSDIDVNNCQPISTQEDVYLSIGEPIVTNVLDGYNACIFSYGLTGAGKSYTLIGGNTEESKGLTPRICEGLFSRIGKLTNSPSNTSTPVNIRYEIAVSYLEIYAEQIRDLINPENKKVLKVREHPLTGPYVEDLTIIPAENFYAVNQFMLFGNKHRVTASTKMNDTSSRSHAVFTVYLSQIDKQTNKEILKSKLCLVDLAGSERVKESGVSGIHLKEAVDINTSLTTLGRVISALAKYSNEPSQSQCFVPFRDSVLTWLLKDSLGGNSKTVMIAAISPASISYEETLNTLQYASRAKQIVNRVSINSECREQLMVKLQKEIDALEKQLEYLRHVNFEDINERIRQINSVRDQMQQRQKMLEDLGMTWDQRIKETQHLQERTLQEYSKHNKTIRDSLQLPFLINMGGRGSGDCGNISIMESLIYYIGVGLTDGTSLHPVLKCSFEHNDDGVWVTPVETIIINGNILSGKQLLYHADKITMGGISFKFRVPIMAIK